MKMSVSGDARLALLRWVECGQESCVVPMETAPGRYLKRFVSSTMQNRIVFLSLDAVKLNCHPVAPSLPAAGQAPSTSK